MNKIDLIIDALENSEPNGLGHLRPHEDKHQAAIAAAHELKYDLYAKEMEQPTPNQSGVISIKDTREPWYKYVSDEQLLNEVKLRMLGHTK
jgi:hypothetical protein